jgi:hypothetical protein
VSIALQLKPSLRGVFSVQGAVTDTGVAVGSRVVASGRARLTVALKGREGTVTIRVVQVCGKTTSTWQALSGIGAYSGIGGGGTGTGRIACVARAEHRGLYKGSLRTPSLPPLAQPGIYGGGGESGNANLEAFRVSLEVTSDGRAVTSVAFKPIRIYCGDQKPRFLQPVFSARYPIAPDRSFSIAESGFTISGIFADDGKSVAGKVEVNLESCWKTSLSWQATNPPPALPAVLPGQYCGYASNGNHVCFDVTSDAWVTNVQMQMILHSGLTTFRATFTVDGSVPVQSDLTFRFGQPIPFATGGQLSWRLWGKFDTTGGATGEGWAQGTIIYQGTKYICGAEGYTWNAKLGG